MLSNNNKQDRALKRLMKDLKEIQMNPLETVYAEPFKGDLFKWYATVLAPKTSKYRGIILLLEIDFPLDYPNKPPTINCLTRLHHSHVFGSWICLDILEGNHFSQVPYMGWSTSYSCLSVLLQLQSFLLEEEERQAGFIQADIELSRAFKLDETGHDPSNGVVYPCAPHWNVNEILTSKYEPKPIVVKKAIVPKKEKELFSTLVSKPKKNKKKKSVVKVETMEQEDIGKKTKPKEEIKEELATPVEPPLSYSVSIISHIQNYLLKILNQMGFVKFTNESATTPLPVTTSTSTAPELVNSIFTEDTGVDVTTNVGTVEKGVQAPNTSFNDIPNEILLHILTYLTHSDLKKVEKSSKHLLELCEYKLLSTARELICYHSKESFKEDILGIGLSFETKKDGTVASISSPLDLLSRKSFYEERVRKSVWGSTFTHWIPIYINRKHGNFERLKKSIQEIYNSHPTVYNHCEKPNFDNWVVYADLMCKLMNSMVVEIMKGNTHASIKALYGYMYFHRWLIYLSEKFPRIVKRFEHQVNQFNNTEKERLKSSCPNLGEFLPKLSILGESKLTWSSVKKSIVEETSIRNALWVIKMYPQLSRLNESDSERCEKSWEANKVSCKLIMFHVFFLRNIVEQYSNLSLEEFGRLYDTNYGCPPRTKSGDLLEDVLQREIFRIQQVSTFQQYFEYVGVRNLKDESSIAKYLRNCVTISYERGYHG